MFNRAAIQAGDLDDDDKATAGLVSENSEVVRAVLRCGKGSPAMTS